MTDGPLQILAVDDQEFDAEALRRQLKRVPGLDVSFTHCADADAARATLREEHIDLIFLDYRLDDAITGLDLLKDIRERGDIHPIVVLTGQGDEYLAAEITRCGADDYIVKSDLSPDVLRRAIDNADAQYRRRVAERELAIYHRQNEKLMRELAEANTRLAELSSTDCLTGVLNRRAWEEKIWIEHERTRRYERTYCVIMLDVDHFKQFNDTQGHQAGDDCLRRVAACLNDATRTSDHVGRYGGEEFVVLCSETRLDDATDLARRIRKALHDLAIPHPASPTSDYVSASFGVAEGPADTWEDVVHRADEALYEAKRSGRNRVSPGDGALRESPQAT